MQKTRKNNIFIIALVVSLLFIIALSSVVSAQIDLRQGSEQVIQWITDFAEPFLRVLLGGQDYTGLLLFEKFLIFILLLGFVYVALSRIPALDDQRVVVRIVSVIVPLLAVRFIDFKWLNTIIIQYEVLGIVVTAILPFIIYLFFLHGISESPVVRKIGWIFFAVVYFGLWSTTETELYGQVYFWTLILSFVFLLLDGTIHRYFMSEQLKAGGYSDKWQHIADLRRQIREINTSMDHNEISERIGKRIIKERERQIQRWMRY